MSSSSSSSKSNDNGQNSNSKAHSSLQMVAVGHDSFHIESNQIDIDKHTAEMQTNAIESVEVSSFNVSKTYKSERITS